MVYIQFILTFGWKKFLLSPSPKPLLILSSQHTHNTQFISKGKKYLFVFFSLNPRSFFLIMKGGKSKGKADNKLGVKKSAAQTKKEKNAAKDPNKPKRPASAFFVFIFGGLQEAVQGKASRQQICCCCWQSWW
uniref:Uncharacterized protein n=1 Tax=Solanum lycopersicum TaxID=4081 RepID=A0A3Q7FI90_SOLLC